MEKTHSGLYVTVNLPSLEIGTVGGGTSLDDQSYNLSLFGINKNNKDIGGNVEIIAKHIIHGVLACELSLMSALCNDDLVEAHMKYNRGIKQAGFQVLWGATMPNVLIEVGFITNPEEAKNLISSKYQDQIANGIVNAIINYKKKYEQNIFE